MESSKWAETRCQGSVRCHSFSADLSGGLDIHMACILSQNFDYKNKERPQKVLDILNKMHNVERQAEAMVSIYYQLSFVFRAFIRRFSNKQLRIMSFKSRKPWPALQNLDITGKLQIKTGRKCCCQFTRPLSLVSAHLLGGSATFSLHYEFQM